MRLWWEVARRGWRQRSTYRTAVFAGLFTNATFGALRAYVLLAVLAQRDTVGGFDQAAVLGFVFFTQALLAPVMLFGWTDVADRVRSGDIATDLYRPVDLQLYSLATFAGRSAFELVFRSLPIVGVGVVAFRIPLPPVDLLPVVVLTIALAVLVGFALSFVLNLLAFWLLDSDGIATITTSVGFVLAGLAVPLPFLPSPFAGIAQALPWASMLQRPVEVLLGRHGGLELAGVLAVQTLWTVILLAVGQWLLTRATARVVVHGG
ncbi:MAG: ABC-2 family transporter protein [Actinobacteria bacterium]|nr:ABC-2 family transporter protein [Actinomycetota bacterium]MBW3646257.1 ABC-2 family transporter protein [Actinomycetota bacterium]